MYISKKTTGIFLAITLMIPLQIVGASRPASASHGESPRTFVCAIMACSPFPAVVAAIVADYATATRGVVVNVPEAVKAAPSLSDYAREIIAEAAASGRDVPFPIQSILLNLNPSDKNIVELLILLVDGEVGFNINLRTKSATLGVNNIVREGPFGRRSRDVPQNIPQAEIRCGNLLIRARALVDANEWWLSSNCVEIFWTPIEEPTAGAAAVK